MIKLCELRRLYPLLIFLAVYTAVFFIWVKTFFYSLPFLLAIIAAAAIQPVISFFEKRLRLKHNIAAAVATIGAVTLALGAAVFLGIFAVREITEFVIAASNTDFEEFSAPVADFLKGASERLKRTNLNFTEENRKEILGLIQSSADLLVKFFGAVLRVITSLPTIITMLIVTAFATFFVSRDLDKLRAFVKSLLSAGTIANIKSTAEGNESMGRKYLLSYLFLYFMTFCESAVVLTLFGLPYPLITAIITACADIIPILGPGFVFMPIAIYQVLLGEYAKALGLIIGWLIISLLRQITEPQLVSSMVKIHPLAMLASVYFSLVGGSLWLLVYFAGFFALHSALRRSDILPPLIETEK